MQRDSSDNEDLLKVREFLSGNERAFEFLFEKYREKVYGIAYRFARNKEDALDITQEVFLRVYQGLSRFKTDSKFYTWLYRITTNRAIDFTRARKTRRAVELDVGEDQGAALSEVIPDPDGENPTDRALRKELSEKLLDAVDSLSPKHKAVFVLHSMGNFSYKEIAGIVGTSIGTVMSRLFYARKKLQQMLAEFGTVMP